MRLFSPAPAGLLRFDASVTRHEGLQHLAPVRFAEPMRPSDLPPAPARPADALILRIPAASFAVGAVLLGAPILAGYFAMRVTTWAVMTDELQIARLATSIAETLSPVPYIHGEYYGALSQLYPLLIAPFFGLMTAPRAMSATHELNALLMPSAAIPAFLLARSVAGSRAAGYAAAVLTAFTPWLVLTSTLLTENAAYPAFAWGVFLCHRALAVASPRRDLAALGGLLLVFFARTQLFVLAAALPIALVYHEVGFTVARQDGHSLATRVRFAAIRGVRCHAVLAVAYGLAGIGLAALIATDSLGAVVGNYSVPFSGDLLPSGIWGYAAAHLVQVVVGVGVLPFLLSIAWVVVTLLRPERKEAHAFASILIVLVPLLTFEVASFDRRFTPEAFIQDRYLFYLVPLFAVAGAAALVQRTHLWLRIGVLGFATGAFIWLLRYAVYRDETIIFWASPAAAFHPALVRAGDWIGLSAEALVGAGTAILAAGVAAVMWLLPRAAFLCASAVLAAFGAFEAGYVFERFSDLAPTHASTTVGPRDWIDQAVPGGRSVALVPSPLRAPIYWWEAELWNKDVDRVLQVGGGPTFTPFPAEPLSVDFASGTLRGPQPSGFLVVSDRETRFHLFDAALLADSGALSLVRVKRPYRLAWATHGVTADGWTWPAVDATLRFYGHGRSGERGVSVLLSASQYATEPFGFTLHSNSGVRSGGVDPGGARPPVRLDACVPADGYADITLRTSGEVRIPDGRTVALHLDGIFVRAEGPCPAAQVSSR